MLVIFKKLKKYSAFLIILTYFLINLFFMRSFWSELLFDRSTIGARYGEVFVAEWAMDKVYQNIISRKNPFEHTNFVLYPFGMDFTTTDSGNGLFFLYLRPLLSQHQSLSVIVALNLFFANLGMYFLLRKLRISKSISFLIGLAYGYMTFLMPRMGHLNYTSIFVFPWFYYFIFQVGSSLSSNKKAISTICASILFILTLYLNLYYFIILALSLCFFSFYWLLFNRTFLINLIKDNIKYLFISFISIFIFSYPWLRVLLEIRLFEELPETIGWGGAIEFSSDLFGYFIPSKYSYFMGPFIHFIGKHFLFVKQIFEGFTYPGLIILITYFVLLTLLKRKNIYLNIKKQIAPYLFVALSFWILTLGPFIHIAGRWDLSVDDGIRIVMPLPYIILHYVPFLSNVRVPGRLIVGFIFLSYIISAHLISFFLSKKSLKVRKIFFIIFFVIFIVDHYFKIDAPVPRFIPTKLYSEIKKDKDFVTVMEAPSTVRDGFVYFGSSDSLEFIIGQSIHNKPVLGGYAGRIPYFKKAYYQKNPFLGYVGRVMDKNLKSNRGFDKSDLLNWSVINKQQSKDAINFLDLKYFVLKEDEFFSSTLSKDLHSLGFYKIKKDKNYSLFVRNPEKKEYTNVILGSENDDIYIGMGWANKEKGFRWSGKKSSVLFKLNKPRIMDLRFESSSFYKKQDVKIYINKKEIGKVIIPLGLKEFTIPIKEDTLVPGINFVYFMFSQSYKPKEVIPGSLDDRNLSAKFTKIYLREVK